MKLHTNVTTAWNIQSHFISHTATQLTVHEFSCPILQSHWQLQRVAFWIHYVNETFLILPSCVWMEILMILSVVLSSLSQNVSPKLLQLLDFFWQFSLTQLLFFPEELSIFQQLNMSHIIIKKLKYFSIRSTNFSMAIVLLPLVMFWC